MLKATLLTVIFSLVIGSSYSQKNLQPGYVVLNTDDTLKGFINYREWSKNPSGIEFSLSKSDKTKHYTNKEVSYFETIGKVSYRKYLVTITLDANRINDITGKNTDVKKEDVFLKLLHVGKNVSLFSYEDEIKMRYYILTNGQNEPEELKNSIYMLNGKIINEKEYQMQLRALSAKYAAADSELMKLIDRSNYSKKAILDICYRLNGISDNNKIKKSDRLAINLFAGAGIDNRASSFSGDIKYSGASSSSTSPMLIAGIDFLFNPEVEKFYLHNSISYSIGYKTKARLEKKLFEGSDEYLYELKQNLIAINSQLMWNIYSQPSLKIFVGGGANANFSSSQTNKQTYRRYGLSGDTSMSHLDNYLVLSKFWLGLSARAGVEIKNINVGINYIPKAVINAERNYSLKTSNVQLQIIYLFRKKKS